LITHWSNVTTTISNPRGTRLERRLKWGKGPSIALYHHHFPISLSRKRFEIKKSLWILRGNYGKIAWDSICYFGTASTKREMISLSSRWSTNNQYLNLPSLEQRAWVLDPLSPRLPVLILKRFLVVGIPGNRALGNS
jgi:hypothetical protein